MLKLAEQMSCSYHEGATTTRPAKSGSVVIISVYNSPYSEIHAKSSQYPGCGALQGEISSQKV